MKAIFLLLLIFWFLCQKKSVLFWFYLWQLKECHWKRFLDHFRTEKGKRIFKNRLFVLKTIFLVLLLILIFREPFPEFLRGVGFWAVFFLFFLEGLKTVKDFFQKSLKKPLFTKKIILLSFSFLLLTLVFGTFAFWQFQDNKILFVISLLIFNILTPLFVSFFILGFEPITLIYQKRLIKKAKEKREKMKNLIVIGITGSYGKTSTKEFLAKILSQKYKVLKTKKHINAEVGIAKTILSDLGPEHQVFIAEIGAYEKGKIKQVCKMLQPQIGILTGLNEQHLATFGSMENIIVGEGFELIGMLPEDGTAVMNWDNQLIKSKIKSHCRQRRRGALADVGEGGGRVGVPGGLQSKWQVKIQKFYSLKEKANLWAEDIEIEREKISFRVFSEDGDSAFFEVNLIGGHNVSNILGASLVAHEKFGFSLVKIAEICEEFGPEPGTMILKKGRGGLNIIDSTYSANPDGVISALDYLKVWPGKKVIVMPCLIELGSASKRVHKEIGRKIAEVCDLAIITTKDRLREIKEGAVERGMREGNILFIENPQEIFEKIKNFNQPDDIILLEGRVPSNLAF
jgi:UDP-N-acetylmuramoyl-tripeptide--D-alanyl-D-alanine ligase